VGAAGAGDQDFAQEMKRAANPPRAPCVPRVIIDTNLVLSALVFAQGRLTPLRQAWQAQRIQPLVSRFTAAELIRVFAYPKFKLTADEQQELLADYLPYCKTIRIPEPPPKAPACRDAFDVPFLELAVAGKAQALITGDRDLLGLAGTFASPIVTAERFLSTLS
jgi:putative PIN family toxin of toxin-antitoxin system